MCGFHKAQFLCSLGLAVVLLAGCGTTAASLLASSAPAAASAAAPASEEKMLYTQTATVAAETYQGRQEFETFLARAQRQFLIPALAENLVPQGMDVCDATGILYISGYYSTKGKCSAIVAVDTATGRLTAEYLLKKPGNLPFDGHVGGVAVSDTTLYLSGTSGWATSTTPVRTTGFRRAWTIPPKTRRAKSWAATSWATI